jgi:hypothetical protein
VRKNNNPVSPRVRTVGYGRDRYVFTENKHYYKKACRMSARAAVSPKPTRPTRNRRAPQRLGQTAGDTVPKRTGVAKHASYTTAPTLPLIVLVATCLLLTLVTLQRWPLGFETVTTETMGASSEPFIVSTFTLCCVRGTFAVVIWSAIIARVFGKVNLVRPEYFPESRLPPGASVELTGLKTFTTFTVQTWLVQGLYFIGAFVCSVVTLHGNGDGPMLQAAARVLWVLYEVSLGCAPLVTAVVTFVLVPTMIKRGDETAIGLFFQWPVSCVFLLPCAARSS